MGKLLKLLRGEAAPAGAPRRVQGHMVELTIVGESGYQDYIRHVAQQARGGGFEIVLRPDPQNPFDSSAVVVLVDGRTDGRLATCRARWRGCGNPPCSALRRKASSSWVRLRCSAARATSPTSGSSARLRGPVRARQPGDGAEAPVQPAPGASPRPGQPARPQRLVRTSHGPREADRAHAAQVRPSASSPHGSTG